MTDFDSDNLLACAADDSATARHLLEEAAERLDEHSGAMSVAEYAQASAAVATGYAHLAALGLNMATAEGAAKQNAQILEMQSVVADAHRAMKSRQRAEQAEIELRTQKLAQLNPYAATLATSGQREERAEARPHQHVECTCEYAPAIGQLHRPNCPAYVAPVGEAAYLLEGDDEIFTAPTAAEELRADRHAEITEADRSEEALGG